MQPDRGLIEDVEDADQGGADLGGQADPLGLPTRQRGGAPVHREVADPDVLEEAQALESELRDAGVDVSFQYYEGAGHAFFNDTNRLGTYDAELAQTSWTRTVEFLRSALTS